MFPQTKKYKIILATIIVLYIAICVLSLIFNTKKESIIINAIVAFIFLIPVSFLASWISYYLEQKELYPQNND